jgi:hypothetical protein
MATMKRRGKQPVERTISGQNPHVEKPGRYADGNGLYLFVEPSGAKR